MSTVCYISGKTYVGKVVCNVDRHLFYETVNGLSFGSFPHSCGSIIPAYRQIFNLQKITE